MNKTQKLKSLIVLKDSFEVNDFLTIIKMKIRDYVFSDEFTFKIDLNVSSTEYITIDFSVSNINCKWSINKRNFICYHVNSIIENAEILSKKEEEKFCKLFYNKLYKDYDKTREIDSVKKQISELEKTLNFLEDKE